MTDLKLEKLVATLLRVGVLVSGAVVLVGGIYYVAAHAGESANYHAFQPQPLVDRAYGLIVAGAFHLRARSIIEFGVLLMIATPVARVAMALVGFVLEKDRTYVVITAIVLALLIYSLVTG